MARINSAGRVAKSGRVGAASRSTNSNRIPPWSPSALISRWLSEMDPANATVVSGKVSSLADSKAGTGVVWTQATAGLRPVYTASGTGGKPCLSTANAAPTNLYCATGGISGNADHEIWAIAEMTPNPATVGSMVGLGSTGASSIIGTWLNGVTAIWAGGVAASGSGALPSGAGDTNIHVYRKEWRGNGDGLGTGLGNLWVDGQFLAGVNGAKLALTAGSGCFLYGGGHQIADANLYLTEFIAGNLTRGPGQEAWLMDQYMLLKNPAVARTVYVGCIGDSWVKPASGLTTGQMWPTLLPTDLAGSPYNIVNPLAGNFGGAGTTSSQVLSTALSSTTDYWSPIWQKRVIACLYGTNDCGNLVTNGNPSGAGSPSVIAATVLANDAAIYAALVTAGYATKMILCTIPARADASWNSNKETCRLLINTGRRAMAGITLVDLAARTEFSDATNTTYYNADLIHPTATGAALVGTLVAAAV